MKTLLFILTGLTVCLYACKDNPVTEEPANNTVYKKVMDAVSGSTRFEIYNNGSENLTYGYNDIGFKVFLNNVEQTTGTVKFTPKYYDSSTPGAVSSSPVKPNFDYVDSNHLFTGYVNFINITQANKNWFGFFNYNDQNYVDSISFNVLSSSKAQVLNFPDVSQGAYYITLLAPFNPRLGLNTFKCMLHQTSDNIAFNQIESAEMFVGTWMPTMGHGSSNNVNPAYIGNGVYSGKVNLVMSGQWEVYDSIKVTGNFITPTPAPKFIFECP